MFSLAHHHGNMLREGWKNLLDCLLTLFSAKLLPECMVEVRPLVCVNSVNLTIIVAYGPTYSWLKISGCTIVSQVSAYGHLIITNYYYLHTKNVMDAYPGWKLHCPYKFGIWVLTRGTMVNMWADTMERTQQLCSIRCMVARHDNIIIWA